jgi:hypothetical protein
MNGPRKNVVVIGGCAALGPCWLGTDSLRFIRGGGGVPVLKELEKQLDPVTHQLGTHRSLALESIRTNTSIRVY